MRQLALDLPFASVSELHVVREEQDDSEMDSDGPLLPIITVEVPWASKRVKLSRGREQVLGKYVEIAPLEAFWFFIQPGPGCETAGLGLARYPDRIEVAYDPREDARFLDQTCRFSPRKWSRYLTRNGMSPERSPADFIEERQIALRPRGWRWATFCKTQYASAPQCGGMANLLRSHIGLVTLLDRIAVLPGLKVYVNDDGRYGRHRCLEDPAAEKPRSRWHEGHYDPKLLIAEVGQWNELIAASAGALKDAVGHGVVAPILSYPNFEQLEFRGQNREEIEPFLQAMKKLAEKNAPP
ncbi:MAG TPA: hypothetical protein VJ783_09935 [Pirellulales bacterium]|nr:hypothetical protein [Pirellulales bacterium]